MGRVRHRSDAASVVAIVAGGHFLSHFYILAFPPLFPLLSDAFGLSATQLGLIMSAISLGMFLQIPAGKLVTHVGAKRVFVLGIAITSLAIVSVGLVPSYGWLLAVALLSGIGQSAFHPADYALLDAAAAGGDAGKSFGVHTFGGYVGFAAAPAVVGTIGFAYGWRAAVIVVGAAGLAYALLAELTLDTVYLNRMDVIDRDDERPAGLRASLAGLFSPGILVLFGFFVMLVSAGKGLQTFTGVLLVEGFGQAEAVGNAGLTAFFAAAAVGVLAGGVAADRWAPHWIIAVTLGAAAATTTVLAIGVPGAGIAVLLGLVVLLGLAYGVPLPSRDRLVSGFSSEESIGVNFGIVFTGASVGSLVSPVVLGAVIDGPGVGPAFLLVGVFFVAAAAIGLAVGTGIGARFVPALASG